MSKKFTQTLEESLYNEAERLREYFGYKSIQSYVEQKLREGMERDQKKLKIGPEERSRK